MEKNGIRGTSHSPQEFMCATVMDLDRVASFLPYGDLCPGKVLCRRGYFTCR